MCDLWSEPAVEAVVVAMRLVAKVRKKLSTPGSPDFLLDVRLEFEPGFTVLFGPSGAGKSTLLDCIAGLQTPDAGRIALDKEVFFDAQEKLSLAPLERRVAYVFQSLALFPHLSTEQNVAYGLAGVAAKERDERVSEILRAFHIEELRSRRPRELSGGEQQRVALARSLVTQPRVLLLDEPLTGLDSGLRRKILEDLRAWNAANEIPILYVTHNRDEVDAIGRRVVMLHNGEVKDTGSAQSLLDAPGSVALAEAAGFENLLHGIVLEQKMADGVTRVSLSLANRELEIPFTNARAGESVQIAIRAGDILLASEHPRGLSARNILQGTVVTLEQRGMLCVAQIDAGVAFTVHLTPSAVRSLQLAVGQVVWLVVKTYSCRVVA
jgi:molybdate transport system ATP-binding protein